MHVPTGTLLTEAAHQAGVEITQPCGGQGRCGRCAVHVTSGDVRRRSTLRLTAEDVAAGYTLACQSVVEGDVSVTVPPQEKIERRLTTDRVVAEVEVPIGYDPRSMQTIQRVSVDVDAALDGRSDRRLEPPRRRRCANKPVSKKSTYRCRCCVASVRSCATPTGTSRLCLKPHIRDAAIRVRLIDLRLASNRRCLASRSTSARRPSRAGWSI